MGKEYLEAVRNAAVFLHGMDKYKAERLSSESVDFLPDEFVVKMNTLLDKVGHQIIPELPVSIEGASTESFKKAQLNSASPVGGLGFLRLGEDGRLYLASKSEHYHTPIGHAFPGFKLIDNARKLGITNATHNNTRGYITRLLEMELVRTVNGLKKGDENALNRVLESRESHVLNRVINLETGSLACEAGIKMMLSRFYQLDMSLPMPRYYGSIPVFLVIADHEGGGKANYHGTTVIAQIMRDMWPQLHSKLNEAGIIKICPVRINDFADFESKFEQYNRPPYKTAGFLHEIIMMNYGGIKLDKDFLLKVYDLCHKNDTPVMCDEIQSCMWYPGMYLFHEYELKPDFVVIGKGFPGGQYAASRIITTWEMDTLNQFGALVTNGQEELASLSYLITMAFAEANATHIEKIGYCYENKLMELAVNFPNHINRIEGKGLLSTIFFHDSKKVICFTKIINESCIDISAQTYKAMCPPAALTKLPIIATEDMVDFLINKMKYSLKKLG